MPAQRIQSQHGFTILEVLIAMTIGLLLAFGLIRVFASSSEAYQTLSQTSQQIENGRHAIQVVSDDLRHAGYYGEYAFAPYAEAPAAGTALPDPCEITNLVLMKNALSFHVQGYNNRATSPLTCLNNANFVPGTDILVVRRVHTGTTTLAALAAVPNDVFLQASAQSDNSANPVLALGSNAAAFTLTKKDNVTPAEIRKYHVHIYFVSPCSEPVGGPEALCTGAADGGRPIRTLKRLTLGLNSGGTRVMRTEALAEGIETMQIDYGIDTMDALGSVAKRDGLPDSFLAVPATDADWGHVMAAQIHILARTPDTVTGGADTKTYNLGTAGAFTPGGNFRRHLFTAQVRIVNPASRREEP